MSHPVVRTQRNPMDWALDRLGLTRSEFEEQTGMSKSYLLRTSQGRHTHIGARILSSLYSLAEEKGFDLDGEILGVYGPATSIAEAYDVWVIEHRKQQTLPGPAKDPSANPFMRLCQAVGGVARMSAILAAPDQLVERYAKGVTYTMPEPVLVALSDMGYEHTEALITSMQAWKEKVS